MQQPSRNKSQPQAPTDLEQAIEYAIGVLTVAFGKHVSERMSGKLAGRMLARAMEGFKPAAIKAGAEKIALERPTLYPGDNLLAILRESAKDSMVALIGPDREDWEKRQRVLEGHWLNAGQRDVPNLNYSPDADLEAKYASWCEARGIPVPDFAAMYRGRGLKVPDRVPALRLAP